MLQKLIPLWLALGVVACCCTAPDGEVAAGTNVDQGNSRLTVVETAAGDPQLATFTKALRAAGLEATFSGRGPFTIFAPTDAAFAALPAGALDDMLADKAWLDSVLTYHVIARELLSESFVDGAFVPSMNGEKLEVRNETGNLFIGGARVQRADIRCTNGVLHVIDRVLSP